jgi:mitotic-spindle organizing protein 1
MLCFVVTIFHVIYFSFQLGADSSAFMKKNIDMGSTTRSSTSSNAGSGPNQTVAAREAFQVLLELSKLLNTGLDAETLAICVRLCENGVKPEALALVINQARQGVSKSTSSSSLATNFDAKR